MASSSSLEILDIFKSTEKAELLSDICVGEGSSKDFESADSKIPCSARVNSDSSRCRPSAPPA